MKGKERKSGIKRTKNESKRDVENAKFHVPECGQVLHFSRTPQNGGGTLALSRFSPVVRKRIEQPEITDKCIKNSKMFNRIEFKMKTKKGRIARRRTGDTEGGRPGEAICS